MSIDFDPLHKWLGIAPSEQPPHCYRLLGLEAFEDNLDVIENAADRQMAFLRGFQTGPQAAVAQEVIEQIQVARSWLLQPERKAQYDAWLREQLQATSPPAPPAGDMSPPGAFSPASAASPLPSAFPAPPPPPDSTFHRPQEAAPDLAKILGDLESSYAAPVRKSFRRTRQQKIGLAISAGAAVLAVVALIVVVLKVNQSWSPNGTLEVDWPEEERGGGALEVEGKPLSVPPAGRIVVPLPGGPRRVSIARPGYKAYELTVSVTPRQKTVVRPVWRPVGADEGESEDSPKSPGDSLKKESADKQPPAEPRDQKQVGAGDQREEGGEKN